MSEFWVGFRATLKRLSKAAARWVLGPGAAVLVIGLGILLLFFLGKMVPLGQLFEWLTGQSKRPGDEKALDVVNQPPQDRVRDGKLIQPGTPDQRGHTQALVVPIQTPGLFDRKDQVKYLPPGADKPVVVDLPEGVEAHEVKAVVVVAPKIVAVTVESSSRVTPGRVEDLLKRLK